MEVILKEAIEKLGSRGDVVNVSDGYARNYLLPRKLAIPATQTNLKTVEQMKVAAVKREANEREEAAKLAEMLASVSVTIRKKSGENDQLFGSVTSMEIADALAAQGYQIDRRKIHLDDPIKMLGEYEVTLKLHRDVSAKIKVQVTPEA